MYWFYILLIIYYLLGILSYVLLHLKNSNKETNLVNFESIRVNNSLSTSEL